MQGWWSDTIVGGGVLGADGPMRLRIAFVTGPDGSNKVRLVRIPVEDPRGYFGNWGTHCWVPEADVPEGGYVSSQMCE